MIQLSRCCCSCTRHIINVHRFNIAFLATTEGPQDDLAPHHAIHASGWKGRVVTTYRPDSVIDVEHEAFAGAMQAFADLTGEDVRWRSRTSQMIVKLADQSPRYMLGVRYRF